LVGTKSDLRYDEEVLAQLKSQNKTVISKSEAREMVQHFKTFTF